MSVDIAESEPSSSEEALLDTLAPVAPKLIAAGSLDYTLSPQATLSLSVGASPWGNVVIDLYPQYAPATVANFLTYATSGFYDQTMFHRVINGFVAQTGGLTTGLISKTPPYNPIPLESAGGISNQRATVAMARTSEPNSATSQFFFNLADNSFLDYSSASAGYAVFGEVIAGMELIDTIATVETLTIGPYSDVPAYYIYVTDAALSQTAKAVSRSGVLQLSDLEVGSSWEYSVDGGTTWSAGAGEQFTLADGNYNGADIKVRQTDSAGNISEPSTGFYSNILVDTLEPSFVGLEILSTLGEAGELDLLLLKFSELVELWEDSVQLVTADGQLVKILEIAPSASDYENQHSYAVTLQEPLNFASDFQLNWESGAFIDSLGNPISALESYSFTTETQTVEGSDTDDTLSFIYGNVKVEGGAGTDTLLLPLFPDSYSLHQNEDDSITGTYGEANTVELYAIELVTFGNSEHKTTLMISDLVSGFAQQQLATLTDLYLAFFGRAPDVSGLEYWQRQLLDINLKASSSNKNFVQIAKDFAWSEEAQSLYPLDASNRDFVEIVYQNCFDRRPDAGGWDYWTGRLDGLGATDLSERGAFVAEVILGAYAPTSGAEDKWLLTNKHDTAMYYVNQLSHSPNEGYDNAINSLLAQINTDESSALSAIRVIDHAFNQEVTLTGVMGDSVLFESLWA